MVDFALNELSFRVRSSVADVELLRRLGRTMRAVKDRTSAHQRSSVAFRVPEVLAPSPEMPGGSRVATVLRQVEDEVERQLLLVLLDYPDLPCPLPSKFHHAGELAHGLGWVLRNRSLAISLDVPGYQVAELDVVSDDPSIPSGPVANVWSEDLSQVQRETLRQHVDVLPDYFDPGTHDPSNPRYVPGKSVLPRAARRLLQHARVDDGVWWTCCKHGFFHRFAAANPTHWNGTTDPRARQATREDDVPKAIRDYWRLPSIRVEDCGCYVEA